MSNEAYDRAVDNAIDAAVEEAEAMGITDEVKINMMVDQYLANELERWE